MEGLTPEFEAIKSFLEREHQAQLSSKEAGFDLPVGDRVAAGTALDGAVFAGMEGEKEDRVFIFRCAKNQSRFRPGTRLRLSREDPRRPAARLELVDDRYDGKHYVLRMTGAIEDPGIFETEEPWTLDEDVFELLDTQLSILEAAHQGGLSDWLTGSEPLAPASPRVTDSRFAEGLTGTMLTAFREAISPRAYYSIQGPPGSGKTHLLARLALYFALEENKRVLITAVAHQSIHHALGETVWVGRRMAEGYPGAKELLSDGIYKLGSSRGNNEGLPDGVRPSLRISKQKRPLIAGATLYAALHPAWGFSRHPFDVILFDEAGQAPIILGLAARLLSRKAVFIGDDAQLPPVVQTQWGEESSPLARMSVIEFIRREYEPPRLLTETRRLNAPLAAVVSDCFYSGQLSPTAEAAGRRFELKSAPSAAFAQILSGDESLIFIDVPHEDKKSACEEEARWAAAVAAEAVRCGLAPQEIGVIAPYRAQCNRIRFLLGTDSRIVASTVERFQGHEREAIVISLTSSHLRYIARLAGFLFSPNRLNVAISRARTKVILIGARKALMAAADSGEDMDPDVPFARGFEAFKRIVAASLVVDGRSIPSETQARAAAAKPAADGPAFEPGAVVSHPQYGAGRVVSKSVQLIDNKPQWANEIRFEDGIVRLIVPGLTKPPMRLVTLSDPEVPF